MYRCFLIVVLLFLTQASAGQYFGGHRSRQKWMQLKTDTVQLIYAPGLDSQAQRAAQLIHALAKQRPVSLDNKIKSISVLLQHRSVFSNGYVQLGPYRSEWMLQPDLDNFSNGSVGWTDQLALHEYRHVEQLQSMKKGLSKFALQLFGEQAFDLAINAAVPNWFFEGDAVWQETALSIQGRGRLPRFMNSFPLLWKANKKYTWMKIRNGSFKDWIPSHYELGYLLSNYGHFKYGDQFWSKVVSDAASYRSLLYPFQGAIKKHTGLSYYSFVSNALDFYRTQNKVEANSPGQFLLQPQHKYVDNRQFPYGVSGDSILYIRTSYRHRPGFYLFDGKQEHRLRTQDIALDAQFSYRNGKIVYAAYERDPRRGWISYSSLRILDVNSKTQFDLTRHTRYFTPDISASGKVIAVFVSDTGKTALHWLEVPTGKVISRYSSPAGYFLTDPKFIDDQNVVVAARRPDGQMALLLIQEEKEVQLTPFSSHSLGYLQFHNGIVFFTAGFAGNDDIYAYSVEKKLVYQLVKGGFGKYHVNVNSNRLFWSEQSAEGYQLKAAQLDSLSWKPFDLTELAQSTASSAIASVAFPQNGNWILNNQSDRLLKPQSYSKSTRLLNFHSWRPNYDDPIYSFTLYGENVLNTLQTEVSYNYNDAEKNHGVGASTTYGNSFLQWNGGFDYTFDRQFSSRGVTRNWNQLDARVGWSIPLLETKGRYFQQLNVSSSYALRADFYKGADRDTFGVRSLHYLVHGMNGSWTTATALQHIFPRLGLSYSFVFRHSLNSVVGRQVNAQIKTYLPGFLQNHHVVAGLYWQERDTVGQLSFGNRFAYSRGYVGRYFVRMWRTGIDYHFPIWHPDFGFANLAYLQRIRAALFFDYTRVYALNKITSLPQRSAGAEFYFDTKWWNQHPVTVGFRVSRLLDPDQFDRYKGWFMEFIWPVSLTGR
ncbi:MAG: hypothetical protein RL316_879 [Bacteroidota bacterium]